MEKQRKVIETIFDCVFWIYLIAILAVVLVIATHGWDISSIEGLGEKYSSPLAIIVFLLSNAIFSFIAARQAHKGTYSAGVIGIVEGISSITVEGGIFGIIVGFILFINSMVYLNKMEESQNKSKK